MKSCRQRWLLPLAGLVLAGIAPGRASRAAAHEVEFSVEGGALIGDGIPEMRPRPTVRGDVDIWWAPHPRFNLGLATGLGVTVLPYGCTDVIPAIGERGHAGCGDGLYEDFTYMPRVMLRLRLLLGAGISVGAFFGSTFIMSHDVNDYWAFPYPVAGLFAETRFGATGRFGLRASVGYIDIAYRDSRGFWAPTLAFLWK